MCNGFWGGCGYLFSVLGFFCFCGWLVVVFLRCMWYPWGVFVCLSTAMAGRPFGQNKKSRSKEAVNDSSEKESKWQEHMAKGIIHSMGIYHSPDS